MLLLHLATLMAPSPRAVAENVVIAIADGLRREEVFGGAEPDLLASTDGATQQAYGAASPPERRERLMPFLWRTLSAEGQVLGDQSIGSTCQVTNQHNFSYPGYSETMCGFADARINSNDPIPNPNVTVLEWLNQRPELRGRVAAFGAWRVISSVFNKERCQFTDVAGYEPLTGCRLTPKLNELNAEKLTGAKPWACEAADSVAFGTALEYTKANRPRVLFISLGETDKWAHEAKYDRYLNAAHDFDARISELWATLQALPQYRGKTTLILTCDHGRGTGKDWTSHGRNLPNSRYTWMAFLGPGTSPRGDVPNVSATNGQVASTAAVALGFNYAWAQPRSAPPLLTALR